MENSEINKIQFDVQIGLLLNYWYHDDMIFEYLRWLCTS